MYGLLLLPRAPLDSIDTTVLSVSFLFCNIRTTKISHNKIDISLSPINKTSTFLTPIITTPTPYVNGKFTSQ